MIKSLYKRINKYTEQGLSMKIKIVCATRETRDDFWRKTALGTSLEKIGKVLDGVEIHLYPSNKRGLTKIYNEVINKCRNDPSTLVFMHDDIYIYDMNFIDRIQKSAHQYDMIGIAGSTIRNSCRPSWYYHSYDFETKEFITDDFTYLSGTVGHGKYDFFGVSYYGPSEQHVKLLDGLLMVAKSETFIKNSVRFDEQFDFHMYDMDICRQFEEKKLTMGTYPFSVIHASTGDFTDNWEQAYKKYLAKWGD